MARGNNNNSNNANASKAPQVKVAPTIPFTSKIGDLDPELEFIKHKRSTRDAQGVEETIEEKLFILEDDAEPVHILYFLQPVF